MKSVDVKVYELAEQFCTDIEGGAVQAQVQALAEAIQDAIETWFEGDAKP